MTNQFETLSDSELATVAGGISFSVDFETGLKIDSKLGSLAIQPIKPSDILSGLKSTISSTLDKVGALTDDLGQLFDFI
jgi:bacteriocin-like protein